MARKIGVWWYGSVVWIVVGTSGVLNPNDGRLEIVFLILVLSGDRPLAEWFRPNARSNVESQWRTQLARQDVEINGKNKGDGWTILQSQVRSLFIQMIHYYVCEHPG
jgi:hypothetical protein